MKEGAKLIAVKRIEQETVKNDTVPDIVLVNSTRKILAVQLIQATSICDKECFRAQYENLIVCVFKGDLTTIETEINNFTKNFGKSKPHIFEELPSFAAVHLQLRLDETVAEIMHSLCQSNRRQLEIALRNFEATGVAILGKGPGYKAIARGEGGYYVKCREVMVFPTEIKDVCCGNQPILYNLKIRHITPIEHHITDECNPIACSAHFPVKFRTAQGKTLCQLPLGLKACPRSSVLEPLEQKIRFSPLTKKESLISLVLKEDIRKMIAEQATNFAFHATLLHTVSQNYLTCTSKEDLFCDNATYLDPMMRKELGRQFLGKWQFYLNHTKPGQILQVVMVTWGVYVLATGIIFFTIKMQNIVCGGLERITCLGLVMICFSKIDEALNPLSGSRQNLLKSMQHQNLLIEHLSNQMTLLEEKMNTLTLRIENVKQGMNNEKRNMPMQSKPKESKKGKSKEAKRKQANGIQAASDNMGPPPYHL